LIIDISNDKTTNNSTTITYEKIPVEKEDPIEVITREINAKVKSISHIEDKEEWFVRYKEIINEYDWILDLPETIYDVFTGEELELLYGVVQAEVGDEWSFENKVRVANVIFNRLESEKFFDSLGEVLIADEFCTVRTGRYREVEVSNTTILACEYAFMVEDLTNGSVYFESKNSNVHSLYATENKNINDEAHKFYK
jgi:spore germination cell wall hydrolase CwlJ-like protein